ncbi:hypothetical protein pb186bvf_000621 [Paramecium bursaria]
MFQNLNIDEPIIRTDEFQFRIYRKLDGQHIKIDNRQYKINQIKYEQKTSQYTEINSVLYDLHQEYIQRQAEEWDGQ